MLETKTFDNERRNRYYGLRVGDIVTAVGMPNLREDGAEVIAYGGHDNNRIYLRLNDGSERTWVAEWCTITTKVEDRNLEKLPG